MGVAETKNGRLGARAGAHAALDLLLTDAALGPSSAARFVRPVAAAKAATDLVRRPGGLMRRARVLGTDLAAVATGRSRVTPPSPSPLARAISTVERSPACSHGYARAT